MMRFLLVVADMSRFAGRIAAEMLRPPYEARETIRQLYELGVRSVPLIAVSGFASVWCCRCTRASARNSAP